MKNLEFYLDGKSCLLSAKRLLSNYYHLHFEDDYTKNRFGNHIDVMIDEQGEMTRVYTADDTIELLPAANPVVDDQMRRIWDSVKHSILPAISN